MDDALTIYKLDLSIHKDPIDRMLIWQSLQHGLALVTPDENLQCYRETGLKVVW